MSLGSRICALRKEKNITQEELSKTVNTIRANISNWERDLKKPDYEKIMKMAEFFGVSVDYLLYGSESDKVTIPGSEILILVDDGAGGHKIADLTGLPLDEQKLVWDIIEKFKKDKQKHQK